MPAAIGMARVYVEIIGLTAPAIRVVVEDEQDESAVIRVELPAELMEYPKPDEK